MPWLLLAALVLLALLFVLHARLRVTKYIPWIDFFGSNGRSAVDQSVVRAMEEDVTELARVRRSKDLAP